MGATLAGLAYVYAPAKVSARALVVLVRMALTVPDAHAVPVYFAGSEPLQAALGLQPGSEAATRAVKRAMAELVGAGLVRQEEGHKRAHNRRWLLTLGPSGTVDLLEPLGFQGDLLEALQGDSSVPSRPLLDPVENPGEGTPTSPGEGTPTSPGEGTPTSPVRGHRCPSEGTQVSPPEEEEEEERSEGEEEITVSEYLTRARDAVRLNQQLEGGQ